MCGWSVPRCPGKWASGFRGNPVRVWVCVCVSVWVWVCVSVCVWVCVCLWVLEWVSLCLDVCMCWVDHWLHSTVMTYWCLGTHHKDPESKVVSFSKFTRLPPISKLNKIGTKYVHLTVQYTKNQRNFRPEIQHHVEKITAHQISFRILKKCVLAINRSVAKHNTHSRLWNQGICTSCVINRTCRTHSPESIY